jgi:hypothetical protein
MDIRAAEDRKERQLFLGKKVWWLGPLSETAGEFGGMFRSKKVSLQADLRSGVAKVWLSSGRDGDSCPLIKIRKSEGFY